MRQRGLNRPSVTQAFDTSRVNLPGAVESIWQPIYDYQVLASAGATAQTFFQVPIGQAAKTLNDTNMDLAGQLPKGQTFQITGVQVEILPFDNISATTEQNFSDDVYTTTRQGYLILRIGSRRS